MTAFISCTGLRPSLSTLFTFNQSFVSHRSIHGDTPRNRRSTIRRTMITAQASERLAIMVNGVPGKMATATAEEVLRRGFILADEALTGPGMDPSFVVRSNAQVKLSPPEDHLACLNRVRNKYSRLVIVDYTHPSAVNPNVEKYAASGLSFVVGTTGGDVNAMKKTVSETDGVYAVIAPNMGKQIVAFQAMMDMMATQFPGAFSGYTLSVKESHQANKADTSGTAKAVVDSFTKMGLQFSVDDIEKVREASRSVEEMNVPPHFVTQGHAFHTYHLTSPDGSVNFEFQHNVCGRSFYAAGTVDACQFVDTQRQNAHDQRVFNMIDILQSGKMS